MIDLAMEFLIFGEAFIHHDLGVLRTNEVKITGLGYAYLDSLFHCSEVTHLILGPDGIEKQQFQAVLDKLHRM